MIGRTPAAQEDLSFDQFNSNLATGESRIANDIIDKKNSKRNKQCAYVLRCWQRCVEWVRSHCVGW